MGVRMEMKILLKASFLGFKGMSETDSPGPPSAELWDRRRAASCPKQQEERKTDTN